VRVRRVSRSSQQEGCKESSGLNASESSAISHQRHKASERTRGYNPSEGESEDIGTVPTLRRAALAVPSLPCVLPGKEPMYPVMPKIIGDAEYGLL
jgi:hypothetical protein